MAEKGGSKERKLVTEQKKKSKDQVRRIETEKQKTKDKAGKGQDQRLDMPARWRVEALGWSEEGPTADNKRLAPALALLAPENPALTSWRRLSESVV